MRANYRSSAHVVRGKAVLDIGGGTGIGHDFLLEKKPNRILSLDKKITPGQNAKCQNPPVEYRRGDFFEVDLPDESFDVVICLGTLFYLGDHDAALAKMRRLLRPGGMLIINCINQELIGGYFGMRLQDIDAKFSAAYDAAEFRVLLTRHFGAEPALYVQQPVRFSNSVFGSLRLWLTAVLWLVFRQPVVPRPSGTAGMYNYAVITA